MPEAIEKLEQIESLFKGEQRLKPSQSVMTAVNTLLQFKKFNLKRLISKLNSLKEQDMNIVNYDLTSNAGSTATKTLLDVYNRDLDINSPKYIDYTINSKGKLVILAE